MTCSNDERHPQPGASPTKLAIASICLEVAAKVRVQTDDEVIGHYADQMKADVKFPPVVVFSDGETQRLADGRHRVEAAKLAGLTELEADVREGGEREALLYAVEANAKHGLPMSNADKRKVVTLVLSDPEWSQWSSHEIARRCGVSNTFVNDVRKGLTSASGPQIRKATRKGKVYEMDTSRIGGQTQQEGSVAPTPPAEPQPQVPEQPICPAESVEVAKPAPEVPKKLLPEHLLGRFSAVVVAPPETPLSREEMARLPVGDLAAPDAVLFLWTTNQRLPEALEAVKDLGFRYSTLVTWARAECERGEWLWEQTTQCIVAGRGSPTPTLAKGTTAVWQNSVRDYGDFTNFHDMVNDVCPGLKVELFARRGRPGWVSLKAKGEDEWEQLSPPEEALNQATESAA
jgi:N6-adenosine-specific RNA methylase IME4